MQGSLGYLIDRAGTYEMPYKRMLSRVPEVSLHGHAVLNSIMHHFAET